MLWQRAWRALAGESAVIDRVLIGVVSQKGQWAGAGRTVGIIAVQSGSVFNICAIPF